MADNARELSLTSNDNDILSKIFDPESAPSGGVVVDASLPSDPNITDKQALDRVKSKEKAIIQAVEDVLRDPTLSDDKNVTLTTAYKEMSDLIDEYPQYASLRNNRAQLVRLRYGDNVLVSNASGTKEDDPFRFAIASLQEDLDSAISLLSPQTPQSAVSPAQCQTLAQAYTQRGALYHAAAKSLANMPGYRGTDGPTLRSVEPLETWTSEDFDEAASRDFFMGGRYGNEIGKALAVHTNPTAKLCGQMVQEAMKREFEIASVPI